MSNSSNQHNKNLKNDLDNHIVAPSFQKLKQERKSFSEIEKSILKNPLSNLKSGINTTNILSNIVKNQSNMVLNSITQPYNNLQNSLSKSLIPSINTFSNTLQGIANSQLKLIDTKLIQTMTNPLMNAVNQIAESQKAMMNTILSSITINNSFFASLSKSLEEAKANPKSVYNWFEYYDRLSEFFWIIPYKMKPEELHEILVNVTTEKEFDRYISKYFNKEKVDLLINDIKDLITGSQDKKLFEQIVLAYNNKSYSLASMGLMSIIDNLKVVKMDASEKEIKEACHLAYLDEFIESLPEKYNTIVGEGGVTLSGGQKQRLAIARALLLKTEILLFDEATSALDNETQSKIQQAINNLKGEYTILIIAHRLSTVMDCDKIFVIEDGTVESVGKHHELMKNSKTYQKLYKKELENI